MNAYIYIENGIYLQAKAFGKGGSAFGELVFNTSATGYEEIISDPSYAGQFIIFTMPEIGIVGINENDKESSKIHASGIFVRNFNNEPSNFRSQMSLEDYFLQNGKFGVYDIDTRFLTKMLRDEGSLRAFVSTEISDKAALKKALSESARIEEINYVSIVSTKAPYKHTSGRWNAERGSYAQPASCGKKIAVIDYGVKRNILNELCDLGLGVEVFPHDVKAEVLIAKFKEGQIDGVFLSNGPGEPRMLKEEIAQIKKMISDKQEKYDWEFIFLGANIDAASEAQSIGIRSENALKYENSKEGVSKNFEAAAEISKDVATDNKANSKWRDKVLQDKK